MSILRHRDFKRKLTKRELREKVNAVYGLLKSEAKPFADDSKEARDERKAKARADEFYFAKTYLPHYFNCDSAPFHLEIRDLINEPAPEEDIKPPILIGAPRDHAKSTSVTFLQTLHKAVFGLNHFTIIGSDTKDLAEDFLLYLFMELAENERLIQDFGPLLDPRQSVGDFVTNTDVRILGRGSGQRMRGLKHGPHRPDLCFLDDMENDKNVKNPDLVKAKIKWLLEVVLPAMDRSATIVWVGTILAKRSALGIMIHSKDEPYKNWTRRLYKALSADKKTALWPARWSVKALLAKLRQIGSMAFNKEYQNSPTDEDGSFREQWFKRYDRLELREVIRRLIVGAATDPSSTKAGDDKGHAVVGRDPVGGKVYVLQVWGKKLSPSELMDNLYISHALWKWLSGVIEENALKDYLAESIKTAVIRHDGVHLPLRPIHNNANKEARIEGTLSPLVESGALVFLEDDAEQDRVIEELLFLNDSTTPDNIADALEMAVRHVMTIAVSDDSYEKVEGRTDFRERAADDDDDGPGRRDLSGEMAGFTAQLGAV